MPGGINDSGQIVGRYQDPGGLHGFLYSGGNYVTLDDPVAPRGYYRHLCQWHQ